MRPDYKVSKTIGKGGKGLLLGALGAVGVALLSFLGDGPGLTVILTDAGVSPALVTAIVGFLVALAEMGRNAFKQR